MDIEFNSLKELYDRLKPALIAKQQEMKRCGYQYIKIEDIWNFFKEVKWIKANDLSLYEMVSDIFNTENGIIDKYLKQKLMLKDRKVYFEG